MQFTCTARVESRNTEDEGRGKTYKSVSDMSLYYCTTFFPIIAICLVYKKPEVEFMHISTRQNTTDNNCIVPC